MAGSFTVIDLSQLPAPNVVEELDFEVILSTMLADLQARDPAFTALVESDPAFKILEVAAYRELLIRQRVNEAARGVMLAFASGSDLDQIGANLNVPRLIIDEGDPEALPPVPPTLESDADFRNRIQLSFEGYTTAGSEGSYVFHGLSADGDVKDISAVSPTPGVVNVYVQSRTGDGTANAGLIDAVEAALNADDVRPLTDQVTVQSATIVPYAITAQLFLYPGPDSAVVLQASIDAVTEYVTNISKIGFDVSLSGIYQALHQPGVQRVVLTSPAAEIAINDTQAAFCNAINVTIGGTNV